MLMKYLLIKPQLSCTAFIIYKKKEKSRADLTQHVTWKLFLLLLCHCHNNSIHAQFPFCVYVIILNGNFFDDRKKRREAN